MFPLFLQSALPPRVLSFHRLVWVAFSLGDLHSSFNHGDKLLFYARLPLYYRFPLLKATRARTSPNLTAIQDWCRPHHLSSILVSWWLDFIISCSLKWDIVTSLTSLSTMYDMFSVFWFPIGLEGYSSCYVRAGQQCFAFSLVAFVWLCSFCCWVLFYIGQQFRLNPVARGKFRAFEIV